MARPDLGDMKYGSQDSNLYLSFEKTVGRNARNGVNHFSHSSASRSVDWTEQRMNDHSDHNHQVWVLFHPLFRLPQLKPTSCNDLRARRTKSVIQVSSRVGNYLKLVGTEMCPVVHLLR
jgi:hypothetical protein